MMWECIDGKWTWMGPGDPLCYTIGCDTPVLSGRIYCSHCARRLQGLFPLGPPRGSMKICYSSPDSQGKEDEVWVCPECGEAWEWNDGEWYWVDPGEMI